MPSGRSPCTSPRRSTRTASCTAPTANNAVIDTANRYYQHDGRGYVVLSIDTDRLTAPVRYEDPQRMFPHVYGPIETSAVTEVRSVERDAEGRFLRIASSE